LKYFASNKNIKFPGYSVVMMILVIIASSCNPTKYVPKDETLLEENRIIINREGVKKSDISPYIKQKPNKRIFGVRFHLGLYNLSNIKKGKWPHNWLRNIGEEPVIFDPYATAKSKEQINSYLTSKGYFDGHVMETIETANRKSKVYFNIDLKPPYTIRNIYYEIADTGLSKLVWFDSLSCMIERGKPYDVDKLQAERSRLERFVRDMGFYNFSGDDIYFRVDSTIGNRQVNIYYGVKKFLMFGPNNIPVLVPHSAYKVKSIYIYPDYFPKEVLAGGEEYQKSQDTINYNGFNFITNLKKSTIKYDVIIQSLYIRPGTAFNISNSERSQTHLMSLKTYRLVNIRYNESEEKTDLAGEVKELGCIIQLTPMSRQSFSVELEGTNSGGNLGGALNFIYQNKNLLHGAEQFNLKLKGAYEAFSQSTTGIKSTREFGIETSLRFPKFLVPFLEKESFIKKYNPTTTIQVAYDYQNLPVYTRTVANASFGYLWKAGSYQTHMINPFQLNFVKIPVIEANYYKNVIEKSSYLINSYKDVMISGGNYSFIFNNQKIKKSKDYWFIRINAEASGNLLRTIMKLSGAQIKSDSLFSHYNIFGQPFSQFIRSDIDIRYTRIINEVSSIVYRGFAGIGIPYTNSLAMPLEKQYFEGGANGIRGWQVRSLGPGSYAAPTATYINQTGDIKIEANVEYRFKLFWILEGAVFVDAGNIWAIKEDIDRPGAQFRFNKFIDDFAVGTGFGMRFDLKFVLLRTDIGLKLRDPKYAGSSRWLISRPSSNISDLAVVIAIGYPF
jgi:outer membrane protein assembly factor BamA